MKRRILSNLITILLVLSMLFLAVSCKGDPSEGASSDGASSMSGITGSEAGLSSDAGESSAEESSLSLSDALSEMISSIMESSTGSTAASSTAGSTASSAVSSSAAATPTVTQAPVSLKDIIPKAPYQAKKLYVAILGGSMPSVATTYADEAMAGALQGLVTTKGTDQIYFTPVATYYDDLLPILKSKYGVTTQNVATIWELPAIFKSKLDGYILYSIDMQSSKMGDGSYQMKNVDPSVNVATTIANQLNAIIVSAENEQKAKDLGLTKLLDVSGWKDEDFLNGGKAAKYFSKLNMSAVTENSTFYSVECRDYTVMSNTFLFKSLSTSRNAIFDLYEDNTPLLGWGGENEGNNVMQATAKGLYTVATSPGHNFSTLSGFKVDSVKQKRAATPAAVPGTHTVTFMFTDGDNIPFNVSNMYNRAWYGNKNIGNIKVGFGLSSVLIDIAGPALNNYYTNMSTNTNFIAHLSGLGYMYPSRLPVGVLDTHVKQVNAYMKRSDLKILQVMDYDKIDDMAMWGKYLAQPDIQALFYIDYTNYAKAEGKVNWSGSKPIIGTRYAMWTGLPRGDSPYIISSINNASTDITSTDSYSLISVHCWTKSVTDIANMIALFDTDVRVVTAEEFVTLMKNNVKK